MQRPVATLVGTLLLLAVVGCGQVQDAAKNAAGAAASQAASGASDAVRGRICSPLKDGLLSAQDRQVLSRLLPAAKAAGVPAQFVTPLEDIAKAGDQGSAASVASLRKACGLTSRPTSGSK